MSENASVEIGKFAPFQYRNTDATGPYNSPIDVSVSIDTITNVRALSTHITLGKAHPYGVQVLGVSATGLSTAYARFEVPLPPGAGFVEKVTVNWCAVSPTTDAKLRIGLYDHDSTPTLYTSAISTLWEAHASTTGFRTTTLKPGADFTMTPYDVKKDTGNDWLVGYLELTSPCSSTIYAQAPRIHFLRKSGNRA